MRWPRRRHVLVLLFVVGLTLLLQASAWADLFDNTGPEPQVINGLADKWPLGNYGLDTHVDGVKVGLGGVDTGDLPAAIAGFLANALWKLTAFLANAVISLLTFAFSLDLVNGSEATGGAGALQPISDATRNIYNYTFGAAWMVVAVLLAAFWAMWRALVQRRFTEVAGALALSIAFAVVALAFVLRPDLTVGEGSKWSNRMSAAVLSISKTGEPQTEQVAKRAASDQLFKVLVYDPWVVLNFGGTEHCVKTGEGDDPESVPVRPLSQDAKRDEQLRRDLAASTQISADGKTCVNNATKYAAHFLRWSPGDGKRSNADKDDNSAFVALQVGDASKLPDADPDKARAEFGPEDKPAAEQMQAGGQFDRLVMAIVVFVGELGAILLLGALSVGVILAQVIVLVLLAFAPVVLVLSILPGRGHELFLGWLSRMVTFLLRKFLYSLVIAVLLAIGAALTTASANLGWFMAFALQATFFWAIFFYRRELVSKVNTAIAGTPGSGGDVLRKLQGAYYGGMIFRRPAGAIAGAVGGTVAAPVTVPAKAAAAQRAKRRAAEQAANERRRATSERQDLADRIVRGLRPGDQPGAGGGNNAPSTDDGDPDAPARRRQRDGLSGEPLIQRFPAPPRTDDGVDTSTTTRPVRPNGRPGTGTPSTARQPDEPDAPKPPRTDPGARDAPASADVSARPGKGAPDRTQPPSSLHESLREDAERLRELRRRRDEGADDAERREPPRRRISPPRWRGRPPRKEDDQ